MKTFFYNKETITKITNRSMVYSSDILSKVREIMEEVRTSGDEALRDIGSKYDGARLANFRVSEKEIKKALKNISPSFYKALKEAAYSIEKFHKTTFAREASIETRPGIKVWREWRPIERVGLYIPGGKASYPSTMLMLGIPAKLAGCKRIIVSTPPNSEGKISNEVLAASQFIGIGEIYKIGGAQAIAAMAYGTASIPKVDKIFGPGNSYVTAAKILAYPEVDIDMPAGPTEIFIIADEKANPRYIAADILSQLEHDENAQSVFVTPSRSLANVVKKEMKEQIKTLPRKNIIKEALKKSFIVIVQSLNEAVQLANLYAPEHLEIMTKDPSRILKKITNAGSIFLGAFSPVSAGDYATGTNHTLPTNGFARTFSPLSVESFGKKIQVQQLTKIGLLQIKTIAGDLAAQEGFTAHKKAIDSRF